MKGLQYFFIVVALVCLTFSLFNLYNSVMFLGSGEHTKGKIIKYVREHRDKNGVTYWPVIQYKNIYGDVKEYKHHIGSSIKSYDIGEIVDTIYTDQRVTIYSYWGVFKSTIIFFIIGSLFLFSGAGYILFLRRVKLKMKLSDFEFQQLTN